MRGRRALARRGIITCVIVECKVKKFRVRGFRVRGFRVRRLRIVVGVRSRTVSRTVSRTFRRKNPPPKKGKSRDTGIKNQDPRINRDQIIQRIMNKTDLHRTALPIVQAKTRTLQGKNPHR